MEANLVSQSNNCMATRCTEAIVMLDGVCEARFVVRGGMRVAVREMLRSGATALDVGR